MITCLVYLRSPGGSIREVRRLRTRSHTFLASRREPLAGSGVLGVIMAEQVSRPLAPRPLSPHGCGRGQCVGGYGTRPRAKAAFWPEGEAPMVHFATTSFGGRRVTTRVSPCMLRYAEYSRSPWASRGQKTDGVDPAGCDLLGVCARGFEPLSHISPCRSRRLTAKRTPCRR